MDYKKQVEAILFTVNKPLSIEEISEILKIGSINIVKNALEELKKEYNSKDAALEVIEDNQKFRMNIKKDYMHLVKDLMPSTELNKPTIETLAVITWKAPVKQSEVVKIRGNKSYDHIKTLVEMGFITAEKYSTTRMIKLAPKFFEYFDTNKEQIKNKVEEISERKENTEEDV